jgi:hypothetical protein
LNKTPKQRQQIEERLIDQGRRWVADVHQSTGSHAGMFFVRQNGRLVAISASPQMDVFVTHPHFATLLRWSQQLPGTHAKKTLFRFFLIIILCVCVCMCVFVVVANFFLCVYVCMVVLGHSR